MKGADERNRSRRSNADVAPGGVAASRAARFTNRREACHDGVRGDRADSRADLRKVPIAAMDHAVHRDDEPISRATGEKLKGLVQCLRAARAAEPKPISKATADRLMEQLRASRAAEPKLISGAAVKQMQAQLAYLRAWHAAEPACLSEEAVKRALRTLRIVRGGIPERVSAGQQESTNLGAAVNSAPSPKEEQHAARKAKRAAASHPSKSSHSDRQESGPTSAVEPASRRSDPLRNGHESSPVEGDERSASTHLNHTRSPVGRTEVRFTARRKAGDEGGAK